MATNSTLVTNRYLYKELPYDPDGFAPIGMVGVGPLVLLSSPKRPFASTRDLVDYAKQNPGKLTFATFGPGTSSHLAGELFKQRAGIDILHVPFKGATGAARADQRRRGPVLRHGRHRDAAGRGRQGQGLRHHQPRTAGDRTGAAHAGRTGLPGLRHDGLVQLHVAPRGTPELVLERLRKALADALADDAVKQRLLGMGIDPRSGTPAELQAQIRNEQPIVSQLIKQAGVALQ